MSPPFARPSILVTGASGFIGSRVAAALASRADVTGTFHTNPHVRVGAVRHLQCDLSRQEEVIRLLRRVRPQTIVHIAGSKDLLQCERSTSFAHTSHVMATRFLLAAAASDVHFVYISTDCVFDGLRERFREDDETRPLNVYGRMKRMCEELVADSGMAAAVMRVSLVYGWPFRGQTSNTAMDVLRGLSRGRLLRFPATLFNTPIYVEDVARSIRAAVNGRQTGVFHVAGPDRLSRFEFAVKTASAFGLPTSSIQPVDVHSGIRQINSCLEWRASAERLRTRPRGVREGLLAMRKELRNPRIAASAAARLAQAEWRTL